MSSKKLLAASLAAVLAGGTFAVVSLADAPAGGSTLKPGESDPVTTSGEVTEAKVGDGTATISYTNADIFDGEKTKLTDDKKTFEIMPDQTAYYAENTKSDVTIVVTSDTLAAITTLKDNDISDVKGAKLVEAKNGTVTLKIEGYDLKAEAGKKTEVSFKVTKDDKSTADYSFTIDNKGQFTEPTIKVKAGTYVTDVTFKNDVVTVIYDSAKVGEKTGNISDVAFTLTGTGKINGTTVEIDKEFKYKDAPPTNSHGYKSGVLLVYGGCSDPKNINGNDTFFEKTIAIRYLSDKEAENLPEEDDPTESNNSGTTSGDNSGDTETSKPTVAIEGSTFTVNKELEGEDANKAIFAENDKTWKDVISVSFKSDVPFALGFKVKKGAVKDNAEADWLQKGVDELNKAELPDEAYAKEWTMSAEEIAAMLEANADGYVKLETKDGAEATITATMTVKAEESSPNTGVALAIAPAALATAFVTVAAVMSKKKKG